MTLVNPLGLHARPAAIIAKMARTAEKSIWLVHGDDRADAASIIEVLAMGGTRGKEFVLEADSEADLHLLEAIATAFAQGFGEKNDG